MADKKKDREKAWEKVQMKAFTAWVNSYLNRRGKKIVNLETDMCDGVLLCDFLEISCSTKFKNVQRGAEISRVHKIQNAGIAFGYIQHDLGVKLVSLGAEDIVDGNMKLLLGLLWSLFRRLRIQTISEEDKSSEEGLLLWVKKVTDGYKGVNVDKFGNTFNDGLAFLAMINAFDPTFVDYDSVNPEDIESNLNKAFEIAEQKLGIPKLLEVSDLMEGNPDERSVILYVSLFFHAFVQAEEAKKRDQEREKDKKEKEKKLTDLQSQLSSTSERISEIIRERDDLLASNQNLQSQIEQREKAIKDLENRLQDLLAELEELKKKRSSGRERGDKQIKDLEGKIDDIGKQLAANESAKNDLEARNRDLLSELEASKKANDDILAKQEQIASEVKNSQGKLDEEAKRRNRMKAEVEDLKKKVGKEVERRRQKSKALLELQKEVQALRKRAQIEAKARRGLDVLKINLEEHLEDMFQWRDLHQLDTEGGRLEFNLEEVLTELSSKSFEDQIEVLNDRLQAENKNLTRIIKLKDTNHELKEIVEKEGWLYMKLKKSSSWTKAWFVLRGNNLFYYKDESLKSEIGKTSLAECQLVALKAEKVEDPNISAKKFFITKLTVEGQKEALYLGFASLKEKSSWAVPLKSKVQNFNYLRAVEKTNSRPDNRILALFGARDLRSCYLDNSPIPLEGIEAITSVLSLHDLLDTISLVNANLGDNEIKLLSESLSKWKLKVLNVGHNKLTSVGAINLLKALGAASNEYLTELHLDNNEIDDEALSVLAEVLPHLPKLKVLNLSGNHIGDTGVKVLSDALGKTPNAIPALSLSNNNISDAGATSIAALLKATSTIVNLQLAGNEIGDSGAETIAASLADNVSVDEVDFSLNRIGNKGALAFTKLLHNNKTIQTLNLSGNKGIVGSEEILPLLNQHGFFFPSLVFTRAV